jgi:NIPSNAP
MKAAPVLVLGLAIALAAVTLPQSPAADAGERVYELRTYTAAPGKLDALNARFRDHTCKLFEKHGMTNVGYWTPVDNADNKLIYILAHASRAAADQSWKAFGADPDWKKAQKESEAGGKLLAKPPERLYLTATDYSPAVKAPAGSHVYELRTYTAEAGRRDALDARFRDHTIKLFDKHGITNVGYWHPMKGEKGADNTLVYLLAHTDKDAAKKSWDGFRADADWTAARKASEAKAGGALTVKGGVVSV